MFSRLFSRFLSQDNQREKPESSTRRLYPRRETDTCVIMIDERLYPVENWSLGGFLIYGDSRAFSLNDEVDLTMKFKLRDDLMDVEHKAKVVRKNNNKVAFEFRPLSQKIRKAFQSVIDDSVVAEFAQTQLI